MAPLLEVGDLRVRFPGDVDALRGVSFSLERGETLAIVGESGSGKTTVAFCLAGLIVPPAVSGSISLDGRQIVGAPEQTLRALRWRRVALGLQGTPFNPVATVGAQVAEPLVAHLGMDHRSARTRAGELAVEARLDPGLLDRFPHQLSGGERRRATLAMVLALDPDLVVLDEPTSGLDSVTRRQLVEQVSALKETRGFGLIVISHDLGDAAYLAQRCMVLYAGEAMESGPTERVIDNPAHPYSWALVNAYPAMASSKELRPIRGRPPDPRAIPSGCPFNPRCSQAETICVEQHPVLIPSRDRLVACHFGGLKTLLTAKDVTKRFGHGAQQVAALRGISFSLREGESVGVIGPSGSGKSTLARILSGHIAPDSGEVVLEGRAMPTSWRRATRKTRRRVQLVMQDPADALSPRLSVSELVREPLDADETEPTGRRSTIVGEALESVGLPRTPAFLASRPDQLSGGQLQRVALARALVLRPKVLVADEPTSMLDPSEQARLLVVLRERQIEMGLGLVLVSHDLAVVRKVTDRIVVLDAGRVVEDGTSRWVSSAPGSITGRRLLDAARFFERDRPKDQIIANTKGETSG